MLCSCVGRPTAAVLGPRRGLQGCRGGRTLPGMSYQSHAAVSREFWARVFGASYRRTGSWTLGGLCEAIGLTDDASNERLRRWAKAGTVPPLPTIKRISLALEIPIQELIDPIEPEGLAGDNLTGCYLHAKCA